MDAPDDSVDLLELPVVAALRGRSLPVVVAGDFLVVATVVAAASSSPASSATAATPPTAASALATRGAVTSDVPVEATVVAATRADPVSPTLLPYGEVLHLAAVLEQVFTFRVKVAPWIFFPL